MITPITVPRLGWTMEEGTFVEWRKRDGDRVEPGDVLYVLESEKSVEEIETLDAGILSIPADGPRPGDKVKVGQVIAYLRGAGETEPLPAVSSAKQETATQGPEAAASPSVRRLARELGIDLAQIAGTGASGRITEADLRRRSTVPAALASVLTTTARARPAISPRARRVARELGIDWQDLPGSGRNGRIRARDIHAAAGKLIGGKLIPHTPIRLAIAARMVAGGLVRLGEQAAPVTLHSRADAGNLVNLRRQFKAAASASAPVPTYTDMIVKLAAAALRLHPLLQAQWREKVVFVPDRVDIAFAVDTEKGLFAPVLRDADRQTLRQVAALSQELIARARAGKLTAQQMRDATFTVSNLGMFGVDAFTPIINPPQCAVLGIGRIARAPAVVNDAVVPRHQMTLSLTFDHRIVDGGPAARFLDAIRGHIEQPAPCLID